MACWKLVHCSGSTRIVHPPEPVPVQRSIKEPCPMDKQPQPWRTLSRKYGPWRARADGMSGEVPELRLTILGTWKLQEAPKIVTFSVAQRHCCNNLEKES